MAVPVAHGRLGCRGLVPASVLALASASNDCPSDCIFNGRDHDDGDLHDHRTVVPEDPRAVPRSECINHCSTLAKATRYIIYQGGKPGPRAAPAPCHLR